MKKSKKILLIILLVFVSLIVLFLGYRFIKNKLDKANTKKMNNAISEVNKEKTSYVFIEINPSLVLSIKDNKVVDVACLNDDCISMYNDLDIKEKDLSSAIDTIYNLAQQKGFDTSNGVKISSTDKINIDKKDYITIEYIAADKEKELLSSVKNNEEIKNVSNDNYYTNLWKELKKDKYYSNTYACNMNDNNELECYIKLNTGINKDSDYDSKTEKQFSFLQKLMTDSTNKIMNTLKKFNYDVSDNKVTINGIKFGYVPLFTNNDTSYKNVLVAEIVDTLDDNICSRGFADYQDGKCEVNDGFYIIPLNKINLVKSNVLANNIIEIRLGVAENIMTNYNVIWGFEKEQEEKDNEIKSCIAQTKDKGYYCCDNGSYYISEPGCHWCSNDDFENLKDMKIMVCHVTNVVVDVYGDGQAHEEVSCGSIYQACE